MRRRDFIKGIVGSVAAWPLSAHAQQPKVSVIGYLANQPPTATPNMMQAFRNGLRERGYVEGQNIKIEYRWSAQINKSTADELVALKVDVIVAWATCPIKHADSRNIYAPNQWTTVSVIVGVSSD